MAKIKGWKKVGVLQWMSTNKEYMITIMDGYEVWYIIFETPQDEIRYEAETKKEAVEGAYDLMREYFDG
jgi:hypothetical protein